MFVFFVAFLNRPNASLVVPDFCFTPYPIWRPIWHQRTNATFARKVCLDFKSIHAFNPLFAHLAVLSFEVVVFLLEIITNKTTEANFTCPPGPTIRLNFYFYLPTTKIYLPRAFGPRFFLPWHSRYLYDQQCFRKRNFSSLPRVMQQVPCLSGSMIIFLFAAGESWGHASTIRIVLYWEDNQRYTQQ